MLLVRAKKNRLFFQNKDTSYKLAPACVIADNYPSLIFTHQKYELYLTPPRKIKVIFKQINLSFIYAVLVHKKQTLLCSRAGSGYVGIYLCRIQMQSPGKIDDEEKELILNYLHSGGKKE